MSSSLGVRIPLPPTDGTPAVAAAGLRPELARSIGQLHAAAMRLADLDPRVSELVRLRCATWHNCRSCQSVRRVNDGERVLDESVGAQVSDYENSTLTEREKAALRLADAFMTGPEQITPALRAQLRGHFSDAEIVEILMQIIAWTQQKPLVALALDIPAAQVTSLQFDASGRHSIGDTPL